MVTSARVDRREEPGSGLSLVSLVKNFGTMTAVDDIDLHVPDGTFFALLGPSGCGKTTTLRMIAGLDLPTSGQVLLDGADIARVPAHRRPVNTVFQSYALFPHLTIFENVAFGLRRRKVADVRAKVNEMLELVHLQHLSARKPAQLSGGQQQRIALARALVNSPKVLLLDEPLGALDLSLRRKMQLELKRIQQEVGTTFIHVTHDQEEAMTMADVVAVMNNGRIAQLGTPIELYENPADAFVANFLGQSNLLPATMVGRDGDRVIVSAAGRTLALPISRVADASSTRLQIGVRPEKMSIADAATDDTSPLQKVGAEVNSVSGVITDASFLGVATQYLVRLDSGEQVSVVSQNSGVPPLPAGSSVHVRWHADHTFGLPTDESSTGETVVVESNAPDR